MFKVLSNEFLNPVICQQVIKAPRLAKSAQPGQFLIVRVDEEGERIPLTISDYDRENETVTIVTQTIGASSLKISEVQKGGFFSDVVGPLGNPSDMVKLSDDEISKKRYIFVAGGLGTAPVYPQAKYVHDRGAYVDIIVGAKNAETVILEDKMSKVCNNLYICTDDGSKGFHGLVTKKLEELLVAGNKYDMGVAIGPMIMMKFTTITAQKYNLPMTVSLNMLMVDGTGMCGACRVTVGGKVRFACVDGPEFDGALVDFDEAMRRLTMYKPQEEEADHICKIGRGK